MLMDVSSFEAGRLKGSFRRVNLGRLTSDIAVRNMDTAELIEQALFRRASNTAKLDLVVDCDLSDIPVYVDREKWVRSLDWYI